MLLTGFISLCFLLKTVKYEIVYVVFLILILNETYITKEYVVYEIYDLKMKYQNAPQKYKLYKEMNENKKVGHLKYRSKSYLTLEVFLKNR